MNERTISCRGTVRVPLPVEAAIELFTPEGERRWVPGWDPQYPAGTAGREPGTVFVTHAGGRTTTWVIAGSGPHHMRYVRVVPGLQAGTVSVRCDPGPRTLALVEYRSTALDPGALSEMEKFRAAFPRTMAEWERRIEGALAQDG